MIGMLIDEARKAAAPTIAKAPSGGPGQTTDHRPPRTIASRAPFERLGVSNPPPAPARNELAVIATFNTTSITADPMLSWLAKPNGAGARPLPSSCGNFTASNPMAVKLSSDSTGNCQLRGALARTRSPAL